MCVSPLLYSLSICCAIVIVSGTVLNSVYTLRVVCCCIYVQTITEKIRTLVFVTYSAYTFPALELLKLPNTIMLRT